MAKDTDSLFRAVLGANLQTGAFRAILLLAAFSAIGGIVAFILT